MLTSAKGFTLVELLISMAIVGIVMAGIYSFFIAASQSAVRQNGIVQMQATARAAMDFMVRELRHLCNPAHCGNPTISTTVAANDTISFERVEDAGAASGGNTTTLIDVRKATIWRTGQFVPPSGTYQVRIIAGTGSNPVQTKTISANTSTGQLTVSVAWAPPPDATSLYVITRNKAFTRTPETPESANVLQYREGTAGDNPLAENITSHAFCMPGLPLPAICLASFPQLDANTIGITLTARAKNRDPTTRSYRTYTLTETVQKRN
jgi:prepilin-type N-terminal cleavage/methylation domain-containing protein